MATTSKRVRKPYQTNRQGGGNIYILIGLGLDKLLSFCYNR
jgi:hypothetical protein